MVEDVSNEPGLSLIWKILFKLQKINLASKIVFLNYFDFCLNVFLGRNVSDARLPNLSVPGGTFDGKPRRHGHRLDRGQPQDRDRLRDQVHPEPGPRAMLDFGRIRSPPRSRSPIQSWRSSLARLARMSEQPEREHVRHLVRRPLPVLLVPGDWGSLQDEEGLHRLSHRTLLARRKHRRKHWKGDLQKNVYY